MIPFLILDYERTTIMKLLRILALTLVLSLTVLSSTGCALVYYLVGLTEGETMIFTELPEATVRSEAEIASGGITADDVLSLLDWVVQERVRFHYRLTESKGDKDITAQFTSLTTETMDTDHMTDATLLLPYHIVTSHYTLPYISLVYRNREAEVKAQYGLDFVPHENFANVYETRWTFWEESVGLAVEETLTHWGIPMREFEAVLTAFGCESHLFSMDDVTGYAAENGFEANVPGYYTSFGKKVWEPLVIDRDLVQSANEDQLWALYRMAKASYELNMKGLLPDGLPNAMFEEYVLDREDGYRFSILLNVTTTKHEDDNTLTRAEYTPYMVPVRTTTYEEDGTVIRDISYCYDERGNLTQLVDDMPSPAGGWYNATTQTFSGTGELLEIVIVQRYDNNEFKLVFEPQDGQIDSRPYATQAIIDGATELSYCPVRFEKVSRYSNGEMYEYVIPTYDGDGNFVSATTYDPSGNPIED